MRIRKATIKDFDKLKELKSEFYLWEYKGDNRIDPNYVKRGLGLRLAKNLRQKDTVFFIVEDKKDIVGYAGAEIQKNPAYVKFKKKGHLFNLYVRPKYRRKGIGKKLTKEVLKWFRKNNVKDLMIRVYKHNKIAHELYKKFGFQDYFIELMKIN